MKDRNLTWRRPRVTITKSGSSTTVSSVLSPSVSEVFDVVYDTATGNRKDWHNHQYTRRLMSWHEGIITDYTTNGASGSEASGPQPWQPKSVIEKTVVDNNLYNEALSRVYDQVRGRVDLAIAIAESGQTKRLFSSLAEAVRAFRRVASSPSRARDLALAGSNAWLLGQYGIRPLLSEVYSAADNVRRLLPSLLVVEGKAYRPLVGETKTIFAGNTDPRIYELHQWKGGRFCVFVIQFSIPDNILTKLGDWTSLNPASIVWETVPYSFVVDWFLDIGSYIRNLESALLYGAAFRRGYVIQSTGVRDSVKVEFQGPNPANTRNWFYYLKGFEQYTAKTRTVLAGLPLPRQPRFEADLGWQRIVSAASLIAQALGRR